MVDTQHLIAELLAKFANGEELTEKEIEFLEKVRASSEEHAAAVELIREQPWLNTYSDSSVPVPTAEIWAPIARHIQAVEPGFQPGESATVEPAPVRRMAWAMGAAAVAALGGVALVLALQKQDTSKKNVAAADVLKPVYRLRPLPAPEKRIVLTRADGGQVVLDSLSKGEAVTLEENHVIRNVDNLRYQEEGRPGQLAGEPSVTVGSQRAAINLYLADGSQVQVKPGATFGLPDRSRQVAAKVEGLVWFNVKKNSQLPMTVYSSDGVLTRVLGTCFSLDARPGQKTKIVLASGTVRVIKGPDSIQLRPNQQVVLNNGRLQVSPVNDKTGLLAWSGEVHVFRFDSTNLQQAVAQIADYYGLTVENPDKIAGIPITGSFAATKNPEQVLQLIQKAESGAANLHIVAHKIVISRA